MNVDSIQNGVVIDHITAGKGLLIFKLLHLDVMDVTVALMKNVQSKQMGRKDIIKIDSMMHVDFDVIGFVDPGATVNIIRNGERIKKTKVEMPEKLVNVIKCKNPRCITFTEQELDQIFKLTDKRNKVYRCIYCETKAETK